MSGHSKWHSIKHKKGANDAKRGKIFTKHARLIMLAAKTGADPDKNAQLRSAIDSARAENVPNDNIQRAVAKGSGEGSDKPMYEITYEAYGPNGVAILIEAITDNKNRTIASVRTLLNKNGGSLGESGSVAYMFKLQGVVNGIGDILNEDLQMQMLDNGLIDIDTEDNDFVIFTDPGKAIVIKEILENHNISVESAKTTQVAENTLTIEDQAVANKISNLVDKLEEDDDVVEVHTNCEY